MKKVLLITFGLVLLISCDCVRRVSGTVIDKETGEPLYGVLVYNKDNDRVKIITDSTGYFELSDISGGFSCPPMKIVIEDKDHKSQKVKIPAGGTKTIELSK